MAIVSAEFHQTRNDLHWSLYCGNDGMIRWGGYDDANWWDNVAPLAHTRVRTGKVTGRTFTLDPRTNQVEIASPVVAHGH